MPKVKPNHPAIKEARTIFQNSLYDPSVALNVLKPADQNTKLSAGKGKFINIGYWKDMPMFSLTLEERKTCPKDCHNWVNCYGNNMYLAKRFTHGKDLEKKLDEELAILSEKFPKGFVIRLHILGDFYSVPYVRFWYKSLSKYHQLRIFGYSARISGNIFAELVKTIHNYPQRFVIRFSTNKNLSKGLVYARKEEDKYNGKSTLCPQQTGEVDSCINCGLCFISTGNISFLTH